jgi:hypothetical protein
MSRGPGSIENRIGEMFAETRERALSVDELADRAFALNGKPASRAQRSSTIRAAHRQTVRRVLWRATTIGKGRGAKLWFHPDDVPVQVWAVTIDRSGVHWFEVEAITRMTARNVMVRNGGAVARLDRATLAMGSVWWRGVRFVSSRTGFAAMMLDAIWWERYGTAGSVPPAMQMPLADAIALLGVPRNYTRDDVITAFRRVVKKAHPDLGGTADDFRKLVEARDRLLAAIGTSAPPPKMPAYYPRGTTIVCRSGRHSHRRLGQTRRLAPRAAE